MKVSFMASFSIIKRGEPHSILKTTEIALKIINQPSILHILVAFWVLFSNNNYNQQRLKIQNFHCAEK
jgi:hypothetical protein